MLATERMSSAPPSTPIEWRAIAERGRIRPGSTALLSRSGPAVSGRANAALPGRSGAFIPRDQTCTGLVEPVDEATDRELAALHDLPLMEPPGRWLVPLCVRIGARPETERAAADEAGRFLETVVFAGAETMVGMSEFMMCDITPSLPSRN